jgi:hypothetical protein
LAGDTYIAMTVRASHKARRIKTYIRVKRGQIRGLRSVIVPLLLRPKRYLLANSEIEFLKSIITTISFKRLPFIYLINVARL